MSSVTSHSDGDVLINMMGIHRISWSCLALLEQFIQPAAGSLLFLGVFLRFSEGKSSKGKTDLVGALWIRAWLNRGQACISGFMIQCTRWMSEEIADSSTDK